MLADHVYVYPNSRWLSAHTPREAGIDSNAEGFNEAQLDGSAAWIATAQFVPAGAITPAVKYDSGWPWAWSWYETP